MSFHESFEDGPAGKEPSNRKFGLTVGGILSAIGVVRGFWVGFAGFEWALLAIGLVLVLLGAVAPGTLTVANGLWMRLGHVLSGIVNPVVMFLMYAVCITPAGLLARLFGYDPLRRKFDPSGETYWIEKIPAEIEDPMKNQF